MKVSTLFFLLLLANSILAQDRITLINGDVLEGKVTINLPSDQIETVTIKRDKKKTKYKSYEFKLLEYKGNRYVPIKLEGTYRIMLEKIAGYLSLYYFREDESYQFGSQYLYKKDGQGILVPNFTFKKQISNFLNDCSSISSKFANDEFQRKDLLQIVEDYNICIDKNTLQNKLNISKVSDTTNPALDLIDRIKQKLGSDQSELATLLSDIKSKLVQEKPVPKYLISALQEESEKSPEISELITELIAGL